MSDRSWMLNPSAITAARQCILIVQQELNVKLKLSHPQFIEMLQEYAELTDSEILNASLASLLAYAKGEVATLKAANMQQATTKRAQRPAVVAKKETQLYAVTEASHVSAQPSNEMVEHRGKMYPLYNNDGLRFQGLYRGQARYS